MKNENDDLLFDISIIAIFITRILTTKREVDNGAFFMQCLDAQFRMMVIRTYLTLSQKAKLSTTTIICESTQILFDSLNK